MVGIGGIEKAIVDLEINDKSAPTLNKFQQNMKQTDASIMSAGRNAVMFGQNFQKMDQNIKTTSGNLNALGNNFAVVNRNMEQQGRGLTNANTLMGGLGKTTEETGSKLSKLGGFMKNNLTNVSLLAGGIAGLDDQYHRLSKAQVGFERASLMVDKVENRIADNVRRLNKMREEGKGGTEEYKAVVADLQIAQEQLNVTQERAEVAQTTLNEATEDFFIGILPNLIFVGGSAMSMISSMGLKMSHLTNAGMKLKGGITGLASMFMSIGAGLLGIDRTMPGATKGLRGLGTAFLGITAPILAVVGGIWLTLGAIKAFQKVNELFSASIDENGKSVSLWYGQWLQMKRSLPQIFGELTEAEKKMLEGFENNMSLTAEKAKVTSEDIHAAIKEGFLDPLPEGTEDAFAGMINKMLEKIGLIKPAFADAEDAPETLKEHLAKFTEELLKTPAALDNTTAAIERFKKANPEATINDIYAAFKKGDLMTEGDKWKYWQTHGEDATRALLGTVTTVNPKIQKSIDDVMKTAQNSSNGASVAIMNLVNTVKTNSNVLVRTVTGELDIMTGRTQEFVLLQRQSLADLQTAHQEATQTLKDAWNQATSFINNDLEGFFEKFKTPTEKLEKKIKKDVNRIFKVAPELKAEWKLIGKEEEIRMRLQEQLKAVFRKDIELDGTININPRIPTGEGTDNKWDDIAEELLETIDDKVAEQNPEMAELKKKIEEAIADSDTGSALAELMNDPRFVEFFNPTMEIKIAQESINKISEAITNAIKASATNNGKGYDALINPPKGFEMSEDAWEAAGLGEGPDYPGDHPPSFSNEWSKLTPEQQRKLRNLGIINRQSPPDTLDDAQHPENWVHPDKTQYDQMPTITAKDGSKWRQDITGNWIQIQDPTVKQDWYGNYKSRGISYGGSSMIGARPANYNPLGSAIMGRTGTGTTNQMFGSMTIGQAKNALGAGGLGAANPLDIEARQYQQLTKNLNVYARALQQTTTNKSMLARATVQNTANNNIYARTIVTVTKDFNLLARVTQQTTTNNNLFARTVAQIIKNNNVYARTITTVTGDMNVLARATQQNTKNNNTFARTINQVGSNMNDMADDASSLASALNKVASAARSAASAIRSIPKPPSGVQRFASGGDFITAGPELIMVGDNPSGKERVQVTPLSGNTQGRYLNSGGSIVQAVQSITMPISLKISGNEIVNPTNLYSQVKRRIGSDRDRYG